LVVLVKFEKDSIFGKISKEISQHPLKIFQPESLSTVSPNVLDFILNCTCGLKIGYYLLSIKAITDTLGHPLTLKIAKIAYPCCTIEEVQGLLNNKTNRITIFYYKVINYWAIKKEEK